MKNPDHMETVDKTRHAKLRVKVDPNFVHAKDFNLASITMGELAGSAANFPIVFVKHPDNQQFRPVAMFGLRPGENVYYSENGWDSSYVPWMIVRYPFLIGFDDRLEEDAEGSREGGREGGREGSKMLTTCIDKTSSCLSEDEGIALFTPEGNETDFLKTRHSLLGSIFEGEKLTEKFTQKLLDLKLLTPFELLLKPQNEEARKVTGMFTIDERKLKELSPEQIQELHQLDFLPACYIILASLFQVHQLMRLRNRKTGEVVDYRLDSQPQAFNVEGA